MPQQTHLVIGSGPLSLFEALYLDRLGHKVTVLEAGNSCGGAWGSVEHSGWPPVEIGCHIWDIDDRAYNWVSDFLDLKLTAPATVPKIQGKSVRFSYKLKHLILEGKQALTDFSKLVKAPVKLLKLAFSNYRYPVGGAHEFTSKLMEKVADTEIEIKTQCPVLSLDLSGDQIMVETEGGELVADEVVLTSFSAINTLKLPSSKTVNVPLGEERQWVHFHLQYDQVSGKSLSYDRLLNHPIIHRISNITRQLQRVDPSWVGEMLLIGVHATVAERQDDGELIATLCTTLHELGYTHPSDQLLRGEKNIYTSEVIRGIDREKLLEEIGSNVKWLGSTNLAYSIGDQVERWSQVMA